MSTQNITLRVTPEFIGRLDQAASQHGMNRTEYILSWLPITHDRTPQTTADKAEQGQRAYHAASKRSPTRT